MKFVFLLLLFWVSSGFGSGYYLFELHKHQFTQVEKLAPERLYAHWDKGLRRMVFRVTNEKAKFLERGECLMAGSVLDGKWIGGDPGKRYELREDRKWALTDAAEDHYFWLPGDDGHYSHHRFSSTK